MACFEIRHCAHAFVGQIPYLRDRRLKSCELSPKVVNGRLETFAHTSTALGKEEIRSGGAAHCTQYRTKNYPRLLVHTASFPPTAEGVQRWTLSGMECSKTSAMPRGAPFVLSAPSDRPLKGCYARLGKLNRTGLETRGLNPEPWALQWLACPAAAARCWAR